MRGNRRAKKRGKERGTNGGKQVDRKGGEIMGANRRTGKQRDRWREGSERRGRGISPHLVAGISAGKPEYTPSGSRAGSEQQR